MLWFHILWNRGIDIFQVSLKYLNLSWWMRTTLSAALIMIIKKHLYRVCSPCTHTAWIQMLQDDNDKVIFQRFYLHLKVYSKSTAPVIIITYSHLMSQSTHPFPYPLQTPNPWSRTDVRTKSCWWGSSLDAGLIWLGFCCCRKNFDVEGLGVQRVQSGCLQLWNTTITNQTGPTTQLY